MRKAFIDTLCELAARDPRVCLLTADLGYMALEPFRERFPARFLNVGVAEQNMIGVATGMAEAGLIPFAYSIAPFAALRPLEFIRNGPVLHRLPVRIVGMGMGFEYGHAGPTHYGVEDVAALRTLPGLQIVIPADGAQTATAFRVTAFSSGPIYYSLGKDDLATVPGLDGRFEPGRLQVIRESSSPVAILAMGSVATEAAAAAEALACRCAIVSSFNPDPFDSTAAFLAGTTHVITVEAQTISGGLAAFTGSVISTLGLPARLTPLALQVSPDGTSGSQPDRWKKYGLDRASIIRASRDRQEAVAAGLHALIEAQSRTGPRPSWSGLLEPAPAPEPATLPESAALPSRDRQGAVASTAPDIQARTGPREPEPELAPHS